jgi:hypothetical protein
LQLTTDERDRISALESLRVMDTPPEERFDRVVRLAQRLFDVPLVAVNLVDSDRQFTKAAVGSAIRNLPITHSLCAYTIKQPDVLQIQDLAQDPRFRDHPTANDPYRLRFYAGAPLSAPQGQRVGTLCLADTKPRAMTESESALLRDLADWVEKELAIDEDLLRAAEVQRRLSPRRPPGTPGLEVAGACMPSRQVGGDLYDWQVVNGRVQVMLADVMGKGLSAALIGAGVRATIRGASRFNDVSNTLTRAAASLDDDLTDLSTFVTVFLARIDPVSGELDYVDAGHGLAVVFAPDGTARQLNGDGLPLGILPGDTWPAYSDRLADGETLLIISDGVLDLFPTGEAAIAEAARQLAEGIDCTEAVRRIIDFAVGHDPSDDVTAIAVRKVAA